MSTATRDESFAKFKARLEEWNHDLRRLERRSHEASNDTKRELEPHLDKILNTRDAALRTIDEAGEDTSESAKHEAEHV